MAATEVLGRSFSDALYERYCDFDSTFDDLKNGCDIVFLCWFITEKNRYKTIFDSISNDLKC